MSSFHCVTCSDEGVPMRVAALLQDPDLVSCVDDDGERTEVMTALVGDVRIGDRLLVHAGTALLRLDSDSEARPQTPAKEPSG